jgi:hypothetical protein
LAHPSKRTTFTYDGSITTGVRLHQRGKPKIDAAFFAAALKQFAGQEVKGGFKMDDPPNEGFGWWVQENSASSNSRTLTPRHGSFVAAILCAEAGVTSGLEGLAVWLRFPK